jgi:REP element-mobilizing transposase RayT
MPVISPVKHRGNRRADFHDYCRPSTYMITIGVAPGRPALSTLTRAANGAPLLSPTPLGEEIDKIIRSIPAFHPELAVRTWIMMPDHLHLLLSVLHPLERPLGQIIAGITGSCSRAYWQLFGVRDQPLFNRGFHDRIIWRDGLLDIVTNYINDNPRRLLIKRALPDLFTRYNHLQIGEMEFAAYGNIFLLRDYDRLPVMIHRADSPEAHATNARQWMECASNRGVLISPFISPAEKEIRRAAIAAGGCIIHLQNEGFEPRFKPAKADFELCSQGRLLILAPWPDNLRRCKVSRSQALAMNALAANLASLPPSAPLSLRR